MTDTLKDEKSLEQKLRRSTVGVFLRNARVKAELTQADIASHLGYSTAQFVSNWERGLSLPPFTVFPKLITLLGVDYGDFSEVFFEYQTQMLELDKKRIHDIFEDYTPQRPSAAKSS